MSEPCSMQEVIMKHEGFLGEFKGVLSGLTDDVSHIRKRVDNGLSTELRTVSDELNRVERALADFIAVTGIKDANRKTDLVAQQAKIREENWFARILSG